MAHVEATATSGALLIPIKNDERKSGSGDHAAQQTIVQLITRLHSAGVAWEDAVEPVRRELERRAALIPTSSSGHGPQFLVDAPLSLSDKTPEPPRPNRSPRSTSAPRRISDELAPKPENLMKERPSRPILSRTTGAVLPKVKVNVVGGEEELIQEGNATSLYALRPDPGPSLDWAAALRTGTTSANPAARLATSPPNSAAASKATSLNNERNIRFSGGSSPSFHSAPISVPPPDGGPTTKRFKELMQDEYFSLAFAAYLEGARAIELFQFYKEVESFLALDERPAQREKAFLMYQRFLAPGAEREINVDEIVRRNCYSLLTSGDWVKATLFAECLAEVILLIEQELLPKFWRTDTGIAFANKPRSRKSTLLGRISLGASETKPNSRVGKVETSPSPNSLSPPNSPKGPAPNVSKGRSHATSPRKSSPSPP